MRSRGRCSGRGARAGFLRSKLLTGTTPAALAASSATISASVASPTASTKASSSWSMIWRERSASSPMRSDASVTCRDTSSMAPAADCTRCSPTMASSAERLEWFSESRALSAIWLTLTVISSIAAAVDAAYANDASLRRLRHFRELLSGNRRPQPGEHEPRAARRAPDHARRGGNPES